MPERLFQTSALGEDSDLFGSAWHSAGRLRSQWSGSAEVAHASTSEFARGRVLVTHPGGIIARPAQAPGTVHFTFIAVAANHRNSLAKKPLPGDDVEVKPSTLGTTRFADQAATMGLLTWGTRDAGVSKPMRSASVRSTSSRSSRRISSRGVSSNQFKNQRQAAGSPSRTSAS